MKNSAIFTFLLLFSQVNVNHGLFGLLKLFQNQKVCKVIYLEILVSPSTGFGHSRRLEVVWENPRYKKGDWIGLFKTNPKTLSSHDLHRNLGKVKVHGSNGWHKFSVYENHVDPKKLGFKEKCLGYYAAYINKRKHIKAVTCLKIEPTWMYDIRSKLGRQKIKDTFIPGTRNSGATGEYKNYSPNNEVSKYSITQDETVLGQLIYGARYIDVRVGYYADGKNKFWVNNGLSPIHPLKNVLLDVQKFLENTNEIVIIDFKEFPVGFSHTRQHLELVEMLENYLGIFAVPSTLSWRSKFNEIWAMNKQLIIGYDDNRIASKFKFLWPSVPQEVPEAQNLHSLHNHLSQTMARPHLSIWSAATHLKPTIVDAVMDTMTGGRGMAEEVNLNMTYWFRREKWQSKARVVAVDFLRSSGIVRAAIEWNKYEAFCKYSPNSY